MKLYEMTEEDLKELLDACKPTPVIMLQCGTPLTQQQRANTAWQSLGLKMGFDYMTVKPTGENPRFFFAEPTLKEDKA